MKTVYTIIFAIWATAVSAQFVTSPKELFAPDKLLHASAGYAIGATTTVVADALGSKRPQLWGMFAVISAAGGKELYDYLSGTGTPEVLDGIMTFNGGFLAVATVTIPINKRKKRDRLQEKRRRENFIYNDPFY